MKINDAGLKLIKSFEGCKLTAYKAVPTEYFYTIGYGHYGADVKAGMQITQAQADAFLRADVEKFEKVVDGLKMNFNENQFSALVSFAYNCGAANLHQLCYGRTKAEIASKMLLYNKAGGKVLAGLTRRRKAENELYNTPVCKPAGVVPARTLEKGMIGNDVVWLQETLNKLGESLVVDGIFGENTKKALMRAQEKIYVDGILTEEVLKKLVEII